MKEKSEHLENSNEDTWSDGNVDVFYFDPQSETKLLFLDLVIFDISVNVTSEGYEKKSRNVFQFWMSKLYQMVK